MKALCMFALVGLVAGAPTPAVLSAFQDQEIVISSIMQSLQPAIDAAIAGALGETSVTTVTVEETTGPVSFSGSLGDTSFDGSFQSQQSSFNSNYNSASNLNSEVAVQPCTGCIGQQIGGVSEASYHDTGYPHSHGNQQHQQTFSIVPATVPATVQVDNVASNVASNQESSVSTTSNSQRVQLDASTAKRVQQQKIVSAVIGSLTPSIEEAVMSALMANMATTQTQSTFSSTSTQSDAGFTSTSSSASSSSSEQLLITRIIEALTPSITTAVRRALKERYESQQAALLLQQQQQEALLLQQQKQEALLIQQQQAAAFQASQQSQQSSSVSQSELIAQIIAALKPSIASSVQDALDASRFQQQQQQQVFQSQVSNAASQQSSSSSSNLASGTLTNIFGESGSAHNVKVETPEFNYEYNTRK